MGESKFERIDSLKDRIIMIVEGQLCGDLSVVDAKELGEVMDMAKDCAELKKYCAEAEYYSEITEAMKKNKDPENAYYMDKYAPETMRYYSRPIKPYEEMYWEDPRYGDNGKKMYYTPMNDKNWDNMDRTRDPREGRSHISRRGYIEAKEIGDKSERTKELEHYLNDMAADLTEMISGMETAEKQALKAKLTQVANKIV